MKKILTLLFVSVFVIAISAQTKSGYIPFHHYLLSNNGNIQNHQGNARDVAFEEIAYMHYIPASGGGAIYSDSGQFYYTQNSYAVWDTGGNYFQFVNNISWANSAQFASTADTIGQPLTTNGQVYDTGNGTWANSYQYIYAYNSFNYLFTQELQIFSGGSWADSNEYTHIYNINNLDSVITFQNGATLQNDTQYLYTFNGYNNTEIITQIWNGTSWANLYRQSNSFDANGNNYQSFVTIWNGSSWVNYALIIRGYDLYNELVSYVYELWNSNTGTYVNNYQEAYAYVLSNNTQFENYNWDTTQNSWIPDELNTYSFDGNHNTIYEADETYMNGAFGDTNQYYYYYLPFTVSGIKQVVNDLKIELYPNPSASITTISFTTDKATELTLNIYDNLGNMVKQQKTTAVIGLNQIRVDLSGYASGNYWVQVIDAGSGKSGSLNFIKQ